MTAPGLRIVPPPDDPSYYLSWHCHTCGRIGDGPGDDHVCWTGRMLVVVAVLGALLQVALMAAVLRGA